MYILGRFFRFCGGEGKSRDDGVMEFFFLWERGREFFLCYFFMLSFYWRVSGILI